MMEFKPAKIPKNDAKRVEAVVRTGVLDTNESHLYEIYCFLAREITGCPTSWTGVMDTDRQFALARSGFPDGLPMEVPRNQTLCQFAVEVAKPLIIPDMSKDERFQYHPVVTERGVKFYAAFPIITTDGYMLGTLCVSDIKVRRLSNHKINLLINLADKLAYQLEVQVSQRKNTAETSIKIMSKLMSRISDITLQNAITILKFFIDDVTTIEEKNKMIELGLAIKIKDSIKVSKFGKEIQQELELNIGTLKRMKNLSDDDNELMKMLNQLEV